MQARTLRGRCRVAPRYLTLDSVRPEICHSYKDRVHEHTERGGYCSDKRCPCNAQLVEQLPPTALTWCSHLLLCLPTAGGLSIERPGITLQSAPGHHAVIASPVDAPVANTNVIQIRPGAHNGVLRNLEIVGELLAPRTLLMSGSFVPLWCRANCKLPTYPPT